MWYWERVPAAYCSPQLALILTQGNRTDRTGFPFIDSDQQVHLIQFLLVTKYYLQTIMSNGKNIFGIIAKISISFHLIIFKPPNNFVQNFAIPIPAPVPFVRNVSFPIPDPARELQCDLINQFQFLLELIPALSPI